MNNTDMKNYGFTEKFAVEAEQYKDLYVARVISQSKNLYQVICETGEIIAEVSGKFRFEAKNASDFPAVGDFIMIDRNSDEAGNAVIHHILSRKSAFTRKAAGTSREEQVVASNIDTIFICMSLNNNFNLRRLERYLTTCWSSGAIPVVVLTKADLCEDIEEKLMEVQNISFGADVIVTSAMDKDGYEPIMKYIKPTQTIALIGSSGVGKSTLINRLTGEDKLATNGLRDDDRGRHTTTRRELILLPNGGLVMDTPGMRELGMWDVSEGIDTTFSDVEELFKKCKFRDCNHTGEPGCAIQIAIDNGELDEERWLSYQKLKQEAAYSADSEGYIIQKEQKFKNIAKLNRNSKSKKN